jgi:hypothetical protein
MCLCVSLCAREKEREYVCGCVYRVCLCVFVYAYIYVHHDHHITHTPIYQDIKPRRQDPSRDFVNVWQEIGQQRIYVPSKQVWGLGFRV